MKHEVELELGKWKGLASYDDIKLVGTVTFPDPEVQQDVRDYLSTKREYTIPTGPGEGEERLDVALPTESLMYWELALCCLMANTGVRVNWETERREGGMGTRETQLAMSDRTKPPRVSSAKRALRKYVTVGVNSLRQEKEPVRALARPPPKSGTPINCPEARQALVDDFRKAADLAGLEISAAALAVECAPAPHVPPLSLPKGKMAVYVFLYRGECLKVGKVGPKSRARYTSHHYMAHSSNSNLAKSLLAARADMGISDLQESEIGAWIRSNVDRANFLLDDRCGIAALTLLEIFLQCRLRPRFEGFPSQRWVCHRTTDSTPP